MVTKRILAISDIHGYYNEFIQLLEKAEYNPSEDKLIILGDMIDRGPESHKTVHTIKGMRNVIVLKGNHEDMMVRYANLGDTNWFFNGGRSAYQDYLSEAGRLGIDENELIREDAAYFNSLPHYHEEEDYIFVHAGLIPETPLHMQDTRAMLWIRDEFIFSKYDWGKKIIFGHTPMDKVYIAKNKIGIDTGCFFSGTLTCLELPSERVIQVQGQRKRDFKQSVY
jgi:serine/threonine protein phosphatase 1